MNLTVKPNLPAGSELYAYNRDRQGRMVILAHRPGYVFNWITWLVDETGTCYHGHYYGDQIESYIDFEKRTN